MPCGQEAAAILPVVGPACWKRLCDARAKVHGESADPSTVELGRGKTCVRTLLVAPGQTVKYAFEVEAHDVEFCATLFTTAEVRDLRVAALVDKTCAHACMHVHIHPSTHA